MTFPGPPVNNNEFPLRPLPSGSSLAQHETLPGYPINNTRPPTSLTSTHLPASSSSLLTLHANRLKSSTPVGGRIFSTCQMEPDTLPSLEAARASTKSRPANKDQLRKDPYWEWFPSKRNSFLARSIWKFLKLYPPHDSTSWHKQWFSEVEKNNELSIV